MKKQIFIVTSYYPPEIGAASNRIKHLAEGLVDLGHEVTVVTPMPNYPSGKIFPEYRSKFIDRSSLNNVKLVRLWIFASNSKNRAKRLLAMISYSLSISIFYLFNKVPKVVLVQSPPLLVAFTSMLWLRSKKRNLILNVSDLWPSAGVELGALHKGSFLKFLKKIEKFNYTSADLILGQSEEIISHIKKIVHHKKCLLYRNYPLIETGFVTKINSKHGMLKLVYAGLLGVAQGVFELCKNLNYSHLEFHIYGEGAERHEILNYIQNHPQYPIFYHGSIERSKLHHELGNYNFGIIPLKNRIYGSVPSKIFEYAMLGLPIIYFGGGEGERIVENNALGLTAEAGNHQALNDLIENIQLNDFDEEFRKQLKKQAQEQFNFETQLIELEDHL